MKLPFVRRSKYEQIVEGFNKLAIKQNKHDIQIELLHSQLKHQKEQYLENKERMKQRIHGVLMQAVSAIESKL